MPAEELIDVLHYMFEEDMYVSGAGEIEARSKTRQLLYQEFYGKEYQYGVTTGDDSSGGFDDVYPEDGFQENEIIVPFDPDEPPMKKATKSYVPPTDFNPDSAMPFGMNLDAPMN